MPNPPERLLVFVLAVAIGLLFGACSSMPTNADGSKVERSPADPWEPLNRSIHKFNGGLDRVTLKPIAKGYQVVIPKFMRLGVTNFSRNLRSSLNIINHFLQGKVREGFRQTGRFVLNSTLGIGGLIDVGTLAGIEQINEDFGQTLAVWGVPDGPYVVVPFLGPRTLRDATMIPLNVLGDLLVHYDNTSVRDKLYLLRLIDARARLLSVGARVEEAYDPYIRMREAYLQHRHDQIRDGVVPEDEDPYGDFPDPDEDY